jgi:alpha-tubulin suppressor-like RCC1 family protein
MFGFGSGGQMGRGDVVEGSGGDKYTPQKVEFLEKKGLKISQVSCGGSHILAVTQPK